MQSGLQVSMVWIRKFSIFWRHVCDSGRRWRTRNGKHPVAVPKMVVQLCSALDRHALSENGRGWRRYSLPSHLNSRCARQLTIAKPSPTDVNSFSLPAHWGRRQFDVCRFALSCIVQCVRWIVMCAPDALHIHTQMPRQSLDVSLQLLVESS